MAGSAESGGKPQLSEGIQRYPRDLLRQFSGTIVRPEEPRAAASAATEEDYGEIELSLGLSLGGCFGVNPARKRGLHRSSSVASVPILQQREQDPATLPLIKRTSSLPAEVEEEQRKRKELQCLRWMEAKRKKTEKMGSPRTWARDSAASPAGATYVGDEDAQQEEDGGSGWLGKSESELLGGWWAPNRVAVAASHGWGTAAAGRAGEGTRCFAAMSQGSVGSQGSSSSGLSDFGSLPPKQEELLGDRTDQWTSSPRTQSLPDLTEHNAPTLGKPMNCAAGREGEEVAEGPSPWKEPSAAGIGGANGMRRGAMEEMPCVFTVGGGPSGRRVEGLLYRYGKGEEVRIVCVCHGRFFSPAEFVRHAGGGDVAHPLRHIIVNTSPPSFL